MILCQLRFNSILNDFFNPFCIHVAPLTAKLNLFTRLVHFSMLTCILFIQHSVFYFCSNIFHYILAQVCNICHAIFYSVVERLLAQKSFNPASLQSVAVYGTTHVSFKMNETMKTIITSKFMLAPLFDKSHSYLFLSLKTDFKLYSCLRQCTLAGRCLSTFCGIMK